MHRTAKGSGGNSEEGGDSGIAYAVKSHNKETMTRLQSALFDNNRWLSLNCTVLCPLLSYIDVF